MKNFEPSIEYHELLMVYDDTNIYGNDNLPKGFHYEFYKPGDEIEWVEIHIKSGEFMSFEEGIKIFNDFYGPFLNELSKRCFFVVTENGEKIATATISKLKEAEYGYNAVADWFAIKKSFQGHHLSKPMINRFIKLANQLGYNKLLLHTQTTTWLAAKLYLDFGFNPFNINEDIKGWQILKTITNHNKLDNIKSLKENEIYSPLFLKNIEKLNKLYVVEYDFSCWYINNRNDVYVRFQDKVDKYKFFLDNDILKLEKQDNHISEK